MTRGRKKDLTIPPSRALTQQRDYRARKALYLSELENRCERLQEENETLRDQITAMRAGLPCRAPPNPQMVAASSELMYNLESARKSLEQFQSLAYREGYASNVNGGPSRGYPASPMRNEDVPVPRLRPAYLPSPEPSESSRCWTPPALQRNSSGGDSPEQSWRDETYRPPESLRKLLCTPAPGEAFTPSPAFSIRSLEARDSPPRYDDNDERAAHSMDSS
ncbi:hypothetical protein PQX77_012984 [Marasmius sp. AFHP31]|nr:hypothetical protein PQX77_012984 [Marasmius sp. AFHP31]